MTLPFSTIESFVPCYKVEVTEMKKQDPFSSNEQSTDVGFFPDFHAKSEKFGCEVFAGPLCI